MLGGWPRNVDVGGSQTVGGSHTVEIAYGRRIVEMVPKRRGRRIAPDGRIASYGGRTCEQTNRRTNEKDNNLFSAVTGCPRCLQGPLRPPGPPRSPQPASRPSPSACAPCWQRCARAGLPRRWRSRPCLEGKRWGEQLSTDHAHTCMQCESAHRVLRLSAWLVPLAEADPPLGFARDILGLVRGLRGHRAGRRSLRNRVTDDLAGVRAAVRIILARRDLRSAPLVGLVLLAARSQSAAIMTSHCACKDRAALCH